MKVKTGEIEDVESDDVINCAIRPRTSGLNRKLSVSTDFEAISSNLRFETGVIRDSEFDDFVSYDNHPRTSGLNRKLSL